MVKKKYRLVIFDVDGTLLDTTEGVIEAVQYTIRKNNLALLETDKILEFIGPPIQDSFNKFYGIEGQELQKLSECFREYYKNTSLLQAKPYEGVFEVLDKLKEQKIIIAVATYKRQDYAQKLLKHFGFEQYSDFLYGADNENKLKKTDIIDKCIRDAGVQNKEEVLMVGDSVHDAIGAKISGIDFVGVTYGFGYKNKKEIMAYNVVGACDKIIELLDIVI